MIEPHPVLEGMRRDLRAIVLPAVEDDYVRSVIVAMMGILRELPRRICADESWCTQSVEELRAGCDRWAEALDAQEVSTVGLRALGARAAHGTSPETARGHLLAAATEAVRSVWAVPDSLDTALLADIRGVLAADLARQLSPVATTRTDPPNERAHDGHR